MPLERLHRVCFQNLLQSAVDVIASTHETHLAPPGLKRRGLSASRLQKHLPSYFDSTTPVKGPNCNIKSKNKEKITTKSTSCELGSRPAPPCGYTRLNSFRLCRRMVSLTATKTKRMFSVSVAQVKWGYSVLSLSGFCSWYIFRMNS